MQQNNYIEAEDAYRRALTIAPDNNKMCNLGICLMKQGRISEAKENLRRVKPAVTDGPRGTDSHLKAYERAQQMLKDLESEMMNKCGDRVEQSRLFDAFLGSSSIWQPQPCKDHASFPPPPPPPPTTTDTPSSKLSSLPQDDFRDENTNSNIVLPYDMNNLPQPKFAKQISFSTNLNALNVAAQPFYSAKYIREPTAQVQAPQLPESLKRTRSGNAASSMRLLSNEIAAKPAAETGTLSENNNNKARRLSAEKSSSPSTADLFLLPDNKDFEEAILAAVLGPTNEAAVAPQSKIEKRLKVFQDITLSLSPRA